MSLCFSNLEIFHFQLDWSMYNTDGRTYSKVKNYNYNLSLQGGKLSLLSCSVNIAFYKKLERFFVSLCFFFNLVLFRTLYMALKSLHTIMVSNITRHLTCKSLGLSFALCLTVWCGKQTFYFSYVQISVL